MNLTVKNIPKSLVIAMTGATGAAYGIEILKILKTLRIETHLIISDAANITINYETNYSIDDIKSIATFSYKCHDIKSCLSSGSFKHDGMIIAPCSVKTMSSIAYGIADNLIIRAADITLKERRPLVLMLRETPFNLSHIEAMKQITLMGGIIAPPLNSFYIKPKNIEDLVHYSTARILDLFGIHIECSDRWNGKQKKF